MDENRIKVAEGAAEKLEGIIATEGGEQTGVDLSSEEVHNLGVAYAQTATIDETGRFANGKIDLSYLSLDTID
mgnify:CR=1 FL=1